LRDLRMPKVKYKDRLEKLQLRTKVLDAYLTGRTQASIALEMCRSQMWVSKVLTGWREEWLARAMKQVDAQVSEEMAKIDHIEQVAWDAWERSKQDAETKVKKTESSLPDEEPKKKKMGRPSVNGKAGVKGRKLVPVVQKVYEEHHVKGQVGDPRFLDQVSWCIETRMKLLGKLQDNKTEVNYNQTIIKWDDLVGRGAFADPLAERVKVLDDQSVEVSIVEAKENQS